jgi:hypothetical protein
MKHKEFSKILNKLSNPNTKLLDIDLINKLNLEEKYNIIAYMVRHRMPLLVPFINQKDISWLNSCGYLYFAKNEHFIFLITSEQQKHFRNEQLIDPYKYSELKNIL